MIGGTNIRVYYYLVSPEPREAIILSLIISSKRGMGLERLNCSSEAVLTIQESLPLRHQSGSLFAGGATPRKPFLVIAACR